MLNLLTVYWGRIRDKNVRGRCLVVIFAPAPIEEQVEGEKVVALLNLRVDFLPRYPFVEVDAYFGGRTEAVLRCYKS